MIEIEILNDESDPRNFSEQMLEFRRRVVMQEKGDITLQVKSHIDEMVSTFDTCDIVESK